MPECALAARSAAETNGSGPQDAIPAAAGSGAKLGISGLDPDAGMRSLPRVNCGATVIEAAHTSSLGPQGIGQKTSDFSAIPLCSGHHRESPDSHHRLGEKKFSHTHGIDLHGLVPELRSRFWAGRFPGKLGQHWPASACASD